MDRDVFIVGTGIIPMNRRDRAMEDMSHQVVAEALADAQVDPADVNLVVFGNAMAGRLVDQGCLRGQSFLRQAGLRNAGVVNIDNSCGGGASALHMATLATLGGSPRCWPSGSRRCGRVTGARPWPASRTGFHWWNASVCTASSITRRDPS